MTVVPGDWDAFDTQPRVVAVTGSNGKSTTSGWLVHALTEAGAFDLPSG